MRDRKTKPTPKAAPFPNNQNQQASPRKQSLSFQTPFVSTAAGLPLQMEGYNTPTVSEAEFVSVHLFPPGSERQGMLP